MLRHQGRHLGAEGGECSPGSRFHIFIKDDAKKDRYVFPNDENTVAGLAPKNLQSLPVRTLFLVS